MSVEAQIRPEMTMTNYRTFHAKKAGVEARGRKDRGRAQVDNVLADGEGVFAPIDHARARMNGFALISGIAGEGNNVAVASTGVYLGENEGEKEVYAEVLGAVISQGMEARMKRATRRIKPRMLSVIFGIVLC